MRRPNEDILPHYYEYNESLTLFTSYIYRELIGNCSKKLNFFHLPAIFHCKKNVIQFNVLKHETYLKQYDDNYCAIQGTFN